MTTIFKSIINFFTFEKTVYSHRNRTIEIIALENDIDINSIKKETKSTLENEGRVEAITNLRKQFHITLNAAWRFVDKLENEIKK